MRELTEEMKAKYVENGGETCPFCGSIDIESDTLSVDGNVAYANVLCENCNEEWIDVFTLTGIDKAEENTYKEEN